MCGWRDTQEILPWINVFGLAVPHAECLEDLDKWLDYETWSGERQIVPSPLLWRMGVGGLLIYLHHLHS